MTNPFGGDVDPRMVARMMRDPSQLSNLLTEELPGVEASGSAILADIINVSRADHRRLGAELDVDLEADLMPEDRAAELLAGLPHGSGWELVAVFNELARQRDELLRAVLDEDDYRAFMDAKTAAMLTDDPETWDDEEEE